MLSAGAWQKKTKLATRDREFGRGEETGFVNPLLLSLHSDRHCSNDSNQSLTPGAGMHTCPNFGQLFYLQTEASGRASFFTMHPLSRVRIRGPAVYRSLSTIANTGGFYEKAGTDKKRGQTERILIPFFRLGKHPVSHITECAFETQGNAVPLASSRPCLVSRSFHGGIRMEWRVLPHQPSCPLRRILLPEGAP